MKWITHQAAAVSAGLALRLPLAGLAAMCAGAVLPDILDQRPHDTGGNDCSTQCIGVPHTGAAGGSCCVRLRSPHPAWAVQYAKSYWAWGWEA